MFFHRHIFLPLNNSTNIYNVKKIIKLNIVLVYFNIKAFILTVILKL